MTKKIISSSSNKSHQQKIKLVIILISLFLIILTIFYFNFFLATLPTTVSSSQSDNLESSLLEKVKEKNNSLNEEFDPELNYLQIKSIDLFEPILGGNNPSAVDSGVWRENQTSTPDRGSNTVLTGHRWGRKTKNHFYNLDKIQINDELIIFWQNQKYIYLVSEKKVVTPETTEILAPTDNSVLTLYTCTPLFSDTMRLVIVANLEQVTFIDNNEQI